MLVSLNSNNLNMCEVVVSESNGWWTNLVKKITWHKGNLLRLSETLSECPTNSMVVHNVPWPKVYQKVNPEVWHIPFL